MGELLGAQVAIPLIRRIRNAGPYVDMVWPSAVVHQQGTAVSRQDPLLRILEFGSERLFDSLTVLLSHRTADLVNKVVNTYEFGQGCALMITRP